MDTSGFFFYSAKQMTVLCEENFHPNQPTFCRLKDGRVVEYTEWCETSTPDGKWDDYIFLGEGDFTEDSPCTK